MFLRKIAYSMVFITLFSSFTVFTENIGNDLPVMAAQTEASSIRTLVKENFETYRGYYTDGRALSPDYWEGWQTNGSHYHPAIVDVSYGKSLEMMTTSNNQIPAVNTGNYIVFDYSGDFIFQYNFRSDCDEAVRTVQLRGTNGYYKVARWEVGGSMLLDNTTGTALNLASSGTLSPNSWHSYKMVYSYNNDSCDVYIDGNKVVENIKVNATMKSGVTGISFRQEGVAGKTCSTFYDNVMLYSGNTEYSYNSLPAMQVRDNVYYNDEDFVDSIKSYILFKANSSNSYVKGEKKKLDEGNDNVKAILIGDITYVPIRFISENLGAKVKYKGDGNLVSIYTSSGIEINLNINDNVVYINGERVEITKPIICENRVFVPVRLIAEAMNKNVTYFADSGLIAISDGRCTLSADTDEYKNIIKHISYEYPSKQQIINQFNLNGTQGVHPRILTTKSRIDFIRNNLESDPVLENFYNSIKINADNCLNQGYVKWNPNADGAQTNLGGARKVLTNIMNCSFVYLMNYDVKYKERVYNEVANLNSWIDWNYVHFLDTAESTAACAIAYDWLYDYWTEDERNMIANCIKTHGLDEAYNSFKGSGWYTWTQSESNWCFVCNGGIGMGAMAIYETDPDFCSQILQWNFIGLAKALQNFAPEGAWEEGISYWGYLIRYYISFLSSLDNTFGTEFGYLDNAEGAPETGYFAPYMTGPAGQFNYHDSTASFEGAASHFWLAERLKDANIGGYRLNNILQGLSSVSVYDIIWYNADYCNLETNMPLDRLYTDNVTTATFRNSWPDLGALFTGIHGGYNNVNHGHLDIGSFILDAQGERFLMDLGPDSYSYYDDDNNGYLNSVNFYRRRAEGHNTVVINPPGEHQGVFYYDQNKDATGVVNEYVSKDRGGYLKMNMSQTNDEIISAKRGIMMVDGREQVILQDEFELNDNSDVWWFAHTKANITLSDNGKSATLELNGKYLNATLLSENENLAFGVMDAVPLEGSPNPSLQNKNVGIRKLYIHGENINEFNVAVVFTPLEYEGADFDVPGYTQMSDWYIPDGTIADLDR